jgi:hypothetical protein
MDEFRPLHAAISTTTPTPTIILNRKLSNSSKKKERRRRKKKNREEGDRRGLPPLLTMQGNWMRIIWALWTSCVFCSCWIGLEIVLLFEWKF